MSPHAGLVGAKLAALLSQGCAMGLVRGADAGEAVRGTIAEAAVPEAARAGLYLYFGFWDAAHETAQAIPDADGSYWHAIVHRQGRDAANASYWFGQPGRHPIFSELAGRAAEIEPALGGDWNPRAFTDYCERARSAGEETEQRALAIQRIEWQLLFEHSMRSASRG